MLGNAARAKGKALYKEHRAQSRLGVIGVVSSLALYLSLSPENAREAMYTCGNSAVFGECDHGHAHGKIVHCGRPFCPTCGKRDSNSHKRRWAKWVPKYQKMYSVGYCVVAFDIAHREDLRSKAALSAMRGSIYRCLVRMGYERGFNAWHFFGEPRCPNGCQNHLASEKHKMPKTTDEWHYTCPICALEFELPDSVAVWNPHLNLLFDGVYMTRLQLADFKAEIRKIAPGAIINYQYIAPDKIGKKVHKLKYITRATFRNYNWDPDLAAELKGFRTCGTWGSPDKWQGEDRWTMAGDGETGEIIALEKGKCPICGGKIHWHGVKRIYTLAQTHSIESGPAGYLLLAPYGK